VAPDLWMDGQDERIICPRDVAEKRKMCPYECKRVSQL
jgi:hypothetical protein